MFPYLNMQPVKIIQIVQDLRRDIGYQYHNIPKQYYALKEISYGQQDCLIAENGAWS
jgi:hypothetical protein